MSIANEISRLLQAKADIRIAIEGKGVTVSGTATLDDYDDYIGQIQQGSTPNLQTKSVTPTESAQVITADSGYDGLDEVDVSAISSSYVGSGVTRRSSTDLTASGATVTVPAGYYASQATKAVAGGTAGTPTATKGTVSNHQVSVTPSVTNTSGYITGSTKDGTAVTVSASELVSGSETKTENGTYDVTNLEQIVVNVSGGGGSVSVETLTTTLSDSAASIQFTGLKGTPKYFFLKVATQINNVSTTYYYIIDVLYDGTNVKGNSFRVGSVRRVANVTSGLSYTFSNSTLTISSSSNETVSPGYFYNGTYELTYIY